MKQIPNYADQRFNRQCVYCGAAPETREHVPPKIFLDRPYPENLPIVEACVKCNNAFSIDEEYTACLLECVISGTVDPDSLRRDKIKRTLRRQSALAHYLRNAMKTSASDIMFDVEYERINKVVQKIATGHVLYEQNLLLSETPKVLTAPFQVLTEDQIEEFENPFNKSELFVWPEVGSRAMQRLIERDDNCHNGWVIVQPGLYRYVVIQSELMEVRMVFSEYLACQVVWRNEA